MELVWDSNPDETRNLKLEDHTSQEAIAAGVNPFDYPTPKYSAAMQIQVLVQALEKWGYDAAFGGTRRDEEKSRAKERVFSFCDRLNQWDPKNQWPELRVEVWQCGGCRF